MVAIVMNLARAIDSLLIEKDIDNCHFLNMRNPNASERGFVLKFVSVITKNKFMADIRAKKPTAQVYGGDPNKKIYVNDQLTPENSKLLRKTKEVIKNTEQNPDLWW